LGNVSPVAVQINGGLNLKGERSLRRSRAIPLAAALQACVGTLTWLWERYREVGFGTKRKSNGRQDRLTQSRMTRRGRRLFALGPRNEAMELRLWRDDSTPYYLPRPLVGDKLPTRPRVALD
jgi:hypothetical protein